MSRPHQVACLFLLKPLASEKKKKRKEFLLNRKRREEEDATRPEAKRRMESARSLKKVS